MAEKSTTECREGCDIYAALQKLEAENVSLLLDKIHAEEHAEAEILGAKAFYVGKTSDDNPYKDTYTRPEVIIKGIDDWRAFDCESAWHKGWAEENSSNEKDAKIRELEGTLKEAKKTVGELNSVIGEMRTKAYMLQNKINDLTHTLNSGNLVECGRSARVLTQKLIDDVPFLAKNTKAALRKILALLRDPSK